MNKNPNTLDRAAHLSAEEQAIVNEWKKEMVATQDGQGFDSLQNLVTEVGDSRVTPRQATEMGHAAMQQVAIDPSGVLTTPPEAQQMQASGNQSNTYTNGIR